MADLLERIPAGREEDVDLLDPLDPSPPGLNVLDCTDHDLGTDQLVGIFRRVFERFWGPRTDDILRAALLTLMHAAPGSTLADVPALLTSRERQAELASQIEDSVLSPFWKWYGQLSDPVRAQITGPVLNKLRAFLLRSPVRAIVGQPTTTLDIPRALDEGRLLLAKLPKGTVGEDTSRLLGSFVFARVWQTVLARADQPPERRADAACYVDEVHNYLNLPTPFEDVLAEARAYRLSLGLAHQHLAQLPRELREALGANARTKIYFQLSRDDAAHLERETRPELSAHDLSHLPRYTAAVKLCHDGEPTFAFTLTTQPLPPAQPGQARAIRSAASRRGTPYTHVEEQLDHSTREPLKRRTRRGDPARAVALQSRRGARSDRLDQARPPHRSQRAIHAAGCRGNASQGCARRVVRRAHPSPPVPRQAHARLLRRAALSRSSADVDLTASRITVGSSKTDAGLRQIDLLPALRDELAAHKAQAANAAPDVYVFATIAGTKPPQGNIRRRVRDKAVRRANGKLIAADDVPLADGLTPHKLRHTFASILVSLGVDPGSVMDQLGHADPGFTLRVYRHAMRRDSAARNACAPSCAASLGSEKAAARPERPCRPSPRLAVHTRIPASTQAIRPHAPARSRTWIYRLGGGRLVHWTTRARGKATDAERWRRRSNGWSRASRGSTGSGGQAGGRGNSRT